MTPSRRQTSRSTMMQSRRRTSRATMRRRQTSSSTMTPSRRQTSRSTMTPSRRQTSRSTMTTSRSRTSRETLLYGSPTFRLTLRRLPMLPHVGGSGTPMSMWQSLTLTASATSQLPCPLSPFPCGSSKTGNTTCALCAFTCGASATMVVFYLDLLSRRWHRSTGRSRVMTT